MGSWKEKIKGIFQKQRSGSKKKNGKLGCFLNHSNYYRNLH